MARRPDDPNPDDSGAAAAYLADMSESLAGIARRHGFATLAYILDMAREEAQNNLDPDPRAKRVRSVR